MDREQQEWINRLGGQKIPQWQEMLDHCCKAHQLCPDIRTIGWDVALDPSGVVLVEGNTGWATKVHQSGGRALALLIENIVSSQKCLEDY